MLAVSVVYRFDDDVFKVIYSVKEIKKNHINKGRKMISLVFFNKKGTMDLIIVNDLLD